MKNFKKLLCLIIVFVSASCSKEWLELEQPGNNNKPYFVDASSAYEACNKPKHRCKNNNKKPKPN